MRSPGRLWPYLWFPFHNSNVKFREPFGTAAGNLSENDLSVSVLDHSAAPSHTFTLYNTVQGCTHTFLPPRYCRSIKPERIANPFCLRFPPTQSLKGKKTGKPEYTLTLNNNNNNNYENNNNITIIYNYCCYYYYYYY